jgi:predicted kinase
MIGKKATIKLLPIELDYDLDGRIKTAKLADITDQGKSTVQLIPVDEVDKYVPLKDIKKITDELSKEERAAIQKEIDTLENALVVEKVMEDQEKADEIIKQIEKLQAILKGYQETPTEDIKAQKADVILPIGTSGSGKSTFIKSLPQENLVVISPDDMRVEFTGDINDKSKDKDIYIEAAKRAIEAIKNGKQVVFDTTNLTKEKRRPFIEAIKKAIPTANIQYKLMELNPELAKQRIKEQIARGENRANVSDETIDRHAASYKQMLEDIKSEGITQYDAELAALGTPVDTSKTSIEDAKKIIKPTTGLGDLLVEVDEDGGIVVPQFDTILDPMQNAKNAEELMLAYSNAMIAITRGDVPGDQKLLSNAIELKKNEKEIAFSFSSKKSVKAKDLQENDYLVVKKGIFGSVRQDLFIVENITGNKVEIKSLSTGKVYTATDEILKNNFKKHNKMAYEIKEEVAITEEDKAAVVETKNNLDDISKNETMLNEAKENSKSMSKSDRLSKLKNNSNKC